MCLREKNGEGGNGIGIHSTCMYKKVFSSGILPTSSAGHVQGSAIKSGWDWQKVGYTPKSQSPPSQSHPFTCQTRDFCFPFHFTFNTIPSEFSLPRIENLSELLSGRYPSSRRLLLATLSAHQTFSMSAHWHNPRKSEYSSELEEAGHCSC